MGGMVGALSPKFIIQAGVLLLSARVDTHEIKAALDPSAPITTISLALAPRVGVPAEPAGGVEVVHGRAIELNRSSLPVRRVRVDDSGAAPLVIGSDLLARVMLLLDFNRNRFAVVETKDRGLLQGDVSAHASRGMTAVPLSLSPGGCLSMKGEDAAGRPITIAIVGAPGHADERAGAMQIRFRQTTLPGVPSSTVGHRCGVDAELRWDAFAHHRVMLDFPHNSLWLASTN